MDLIHSDYISVFSALIRSLQLCLSSSVFPWFHFTPTWSLWTMISFPFWFPHHCKHHRSSPPSLSSSGSWESMAWQHQYQVGIFSSLVPRWRNALLIQQPHPQYSNTDEDRTHSQLSMYIKTICLHLARKSLETPIIEFLDWYVKKNTQRKRTCSSVII